jgi:uncharacterized repeat protein (TIGR01451 family)
MSVDSGHEHNQRAQAERASEEEEEREIDMSNKSSHLIRIALTAMLLVAPAFAQVTAEMTASKLAMEGRKETKVSASEAKPGDVIEYSVVYRNRDANVARNVMATMPVPKGMEFLPKTASPMEVMASLDGAHFAAVPLMRKVKQADGTEAEQMVPFSEYRFLRWSLGELPANGSKSVSARMRILSTPSVMARK